MNEYDELTQERKNIELAQAALQPHIKKCIDDFGYVVTLNALSWFFDCIHREFNKDKDE